MLNQLMKLLLLQQQPFIMPVVKINSNHIGDGKPGKFTSALRAEYIKQAIATAI
jgi:hypothetical protein